MEMEDRHPPLHLQFPAAGTLDLRHFISSSSSPAAVAGSGGGGVLRPIPNQNSSHHYFPVLQPDASPFFSPLHHRDHHTFPPPPPPPAYDMMMQLLPRSQPEFRGADSGTPTLSNCGAAAQPSSSSLSGGGGGGLEGDVMGGMFGGGVGADGGTGRWPRQETLTLLEIRSRLDPKFKEANQKGPLWDEVSRIMSEEHGYQRSGKKCREKFENLYKYYKKTKEGKAGRQDGKHYRFFRQLEALYGPTDSSPTSNNNNNMFISPTLPHHHSSLQIQDSPYNMGTTNNNNTSSTFHHPFLGNTMSSGVAPTNQDVLYSSLSISNDSSEFESSEDSEGQDPAAATAREAVAAGTGGGGVDDHNDSSERMARRSRRRRKSGWKSMIKDFIDSQMRKLIEKQEAWLEKLTRTLEHKEKERVVREEEWRKQEAARVEREQKFWAKERAWIEARDSALMEALGKLSGGGNGGGGDVQHRRDQGVNVNKTSSSSPHENDNDKEMKKMSDGDCGRSSSCNYGFHGEPMYNPEALRIHQNREHVSNANNNRLGESSFRFLMGEGGETAMWENYGLKLSKGDDDPDHDQNP
ncbi:unnamed protein product [Linum trigynum]|uniref:Myb-like domain-containing protein n=3 Tax=Linum trigynum TaxID=586398 RepID=A0AAV2FJD6_9ROSI